jgi:hypothetical protein
LVITHYSPPSLTPDNTFCILGFFSTENKKFGQFFVAVQTFTRRIFVIPLKNLTLSSLLSAMTAMKKVRGEK